jgi:putative salt-induced outer membrane protein YdiY
MYLLMDKLDFVSNPLIKEVRFFRVNGVFSVVYTLIIPFAMAIAVCSTTTALPQSMAERIESKSEYSPPPQPRSGDFDWIQFKNGEWLKGEIKDLQDKNLSFESDELDTLQLDWEDIYTLYSPKENTCIFDDNSSVLGSVHVEGNEVVIMTSEGEKRYNRANLRSIIPGGLTEWDYWSLKYSLGVTVRKGNTDQSDILSILKIQRRGPGRRSYGTRTQFELIGTYGSFEGEETTNNQLGLLRHDIYLTRRLYLTAPYFEYYRDDFHNIAYRLTPGAGLGYDIIDRGDVEWRVGAGGGYQYIRYDEVLPGEDSSIDGTVFLGSSDFSWELTEKLDFELGYSMTYGLDSDLATNQHALAMLSFDVWKDFEIDISLEWDRVGSPQRKADGDKPNENDIRLFFGIGLEF